METAEMVLEYLRVLIWPILLLCSILLFKRQLRWLFTRIKSAVLPGGISIETYPLEIESARDLSQKVREEEAERSEKTDKERPIPLTDANRRILELGLLPSPSGLEISYYEDLSIQDPNLALAGMRMEIETMIKNLAKGFHVDIAPRDSTRVMVEKLLNVNGITHNQAQLILRVVALCNAAIHGVRVSQVQAKDILDIASTLRDYYVSWLSWGFPKTSR